MSYFIEMKHSAIWQYLITGLFLILLGSCGHETPETSPLVQVGDAIISIEDFKRAYLPVLLYSDKRESPETREEILNFLIDQSILSQTARSLELDTIPTLKVLQRTALKTAFTRILYHDQVKDKIPEITEAELRQAYLRSHNQRLVRHLFLKDGSEAARIHTELDQGASWDSLASIHFEEPSLAANGGILGWIKFGDMDSDFEDAAYGISVNATSEPVKTKFGWHILRVDAESRELMPTEYDYQLERSSLIQTVRQRYETRLAESAITEMMNRAQLQFNTVTAPRVWTLMHDQIHRLLDDADLAEIPNAELDNFEAILEPLLEDEMLTFSGTRWTVRDFLNHLPEMNRQLMFSDLKKATGFLVRDEIIYETGLAQRLDERESVQAEVRDRENQFLANLYLRYRASTQTLSPAAVRNFYGIQANTRYLAPDSLYIHELKGVSPAHFSAVVDSLNQGQKPADLSSQHPFKIVNLGWFQGARADRPDYYHRLVGKPLHTAIGLTDSPVGSVIILATSRHRHPKPLEQIYSTVEQDAYDEWIGRLKLEEIKTLKQNFHITVDRELLHSFTL